jgi:hypothetical protein
LGHVVVSGGGTMPRPESEHSPIRRARQLCSY